ncbi:MAG: transaldolase family protein [Spirochaetia bacterium]
MKSGLTKSVSDLVHDFVLEKSAREEKTLSFSEDSFWKGLRGVGTELWLDTGDMDAASKVWTREFSALTTNNTLLNKEVQKGIYDDVVRDAGRLLGSLDEPQRVMEIAFILNALHGLRLVKRFNALVSVELHTATADDVDAAVSYGRRFSRISPKNFIVKVPFTAAGFISTRTLRGEGIPVNFTLGFSARENYLIARFASPSYVNVFLGRLNSYVVDNALGDGLMVGEKATLASQAAVTKVSREAKKPTRQIAASMRGGSQVRDLAGVDVMTIPTATAAEAREKLDGKWTSKLEESYRVALAPGVDPGKSGLSALWDVTEKEEKLADSLVKQVPGSAQELADRAHELGAGSIFPRVSQQDASFIASDGKIPKHSRWAQRIQAGELAVDALLTAAGLASFTADQKALDDRIRRLIG